MSDTLKPSDEDCRKDCDICWDESGRPWPCAKNLRAAQVEQPTLPLSDAVQLYQFLRDEDSWLDDGDRWIKLGGLTGAAFDDFVRTKMNLKEKCNG